MANNNEPMIKLEPGGKAPILSYDVPEPTSYSGRNFIEMEFPPEYFKPSVKEKLPKIDRTHVSGMDFNTIKDNVVHSMKTGFADRKLYPNVRFTTGGLRFVEKSNPGFAVARSMLPTSLKLADLDPDEVASMMKEGNRLNIYRSMFGTLTYNYVPEPTKVRPRLLLVETYRLSSYLGNYGAGRTIKTFSLLPGEKTKISIKTFAKTEEERKSASSILDSFSQESSDDFETTVQSEQSNKETYAQNFEYHVETDFVAAWGWGAARVSAGVKGGINSTREEFAKNVSSATEKHVMKASAKRDVQINTSYEVKEETGVETSVEREIENINVGRTLNSVFRQMNQEFITLLHLVDVRVAFFDGFAESKREVTLPELDSLLEEVIVDESKCEEVQKAIIDQLENIFDYKDQHHSFVEEKPLKDRNGKDVPNSAYLRVKKDYTSTYKDEATGTEIVVPGIILSAKKSVLRTEGVIVEALLGQGDALDAYSHGLQDEAVRAMELSNTLMETKVEKNRLGVKIIQDKDSDAAKLFEQVFPPPKPKEEEDDGGS